MEARSWLDLCPTPRIQAGIRDNGLASSWEEFKHAGVGSGIAHFRASL
jgi:hypothetical protein